MAAPKVILRLLDQPSPNRIQMDVPGQFHQISIRVNQDRLVTPLKKMTCPALAPIDPAGIAKTKILQNSRQRNAAHLNRQVGMVAHQTKSMDAVTKSFDPLLDQKGESSTIPIIEENGLPAIATQDGVIECPRIVDPRLPTHAAILYHKLQLCKPDPKTTSLTLRCCF
jgi:hypothetical protein